VINQSILSFFFSSRRRHTRFSRDWSSDVCSSDLRMGSPSYTGSFVRATSGGTVGRGGAGGWAAAGAAAAAAAAGAAAPAAGGARSEERRVGKECRSRWSTCQEDKRRRKRRSGTVR